MYTKECKAGAAGPGGEAGKAGFQVARDLGTSDTVLHRWMQVAREAKGEGVQPFPRVRTAKGRVGLKSALARLRKENKALMTAA